jgi:TonB-linked SusC/RagA family outer membrane protein
MSLTARPLSRQVLRLLAVVLAFVAFATTTIGAQAGKTTLTGVTVDKQTGAPVPRVNVEVPGLGTRVISGDDGKYSIPGLPTGAPIKVQGSRVGYGQTQKEVTLTGAVHTLNLEMNANVLSMDAMVSAATGGDPTTGIKVPFAMTRLDADQMPVPSLSNAALSIAGKVAGVVITPYSGAPGDSSNVQIRAIMSPFKNNQPLYVVDGVPLSDVSNASSDFLGLDIESIEVIRGAAAASLYGSRASGGVIAITTKRGKDVAVGSARIQVRQDMGYEGVGQVPARRKATRFKMNEYGQYVRNDGQTARPDQRTAEFFLFQDNAYPLMIDNFHQVFVERVSKTTNVSVSQATATTNLQMSYGRNLTPGTFRYNPGNLQQNVRFSIGHQLRDNLSLDASVGHTRTNTQNNSPSTSFSDIFMTEPSVNFYTPNKDPRISDFPYAQFPDSVNTGELNPLWVEYRYDNHSLRQLNFISTNMSYRPYNWLSLNSNLGYNKSDNGQSNWTQPGWPTGNTTYGTGALEYSSANSDAINVGTSARLLRDFGKLTSTLQLSGTQRRQKTLNFSGEGTPIGVGYKTLAGSGSAAVSSSASESRVNTISANLKADYGGRYIADLVINREGNSRFGPNNRWSNFYRAAGSWLISEEAWYPSMLNRLSLAKIRANWGSAGGEPGFADQFELVTVSNANGFTRGTLGNPNLKPEIQTDIEVGTDLIWDDKISLQLTYAKQVRKDNITPAVASAITGYQQIQSNLGQTNGSSIEVTLEGTLVQTKIRNKRFTWSTNVNGSHSKSEIIDLGRPCYGINTYHPVCDRVPITEIWGLTLARDHDMLVEQAPSYKVYRDWWQVNDDGYLAPVGPGNNYWEGASKSLWGTAISFNVGKPAGNTVYKADWGVAQFMRSDTTGGLQTRYWSKLGDSQQLFDFGLNNTFNLGNIQGHMQLRGAWGGDVWNGYQHTMMLNNLHPQVDQYMKPDSLKKPVTYYSGGAAGGGDSFSAMAVNNSTYGYSNEIIKNNKWMKLTQVQLSYAMANRDHKFLDKFGAQRLTLEVQGRNLYHWFGKNYPGLDPDGIRRVQDGQFRYDSFRYPQTRDYRGVVTVVF